MDRRKVVLCLLFWLLIKHFACVSTKHPCAHFEFPALIDSVLTAEENKTVTFRFDISNYTCVANQTFILKVIKKGTLSEPQCTLMHSTGICKNSYRRTKCACTSKQGEYEFSHVVHRSDNRPAVWLWTTDTDDVQENKITFNVTYAAKVSNMSIAADLNYEGPVESGKQVNITCTWDKGNPPVLARLLDRQGAILTTSNDGSGQIRYRFPAVGCQDAGLIRCEAPGASHNETAILLVKCPPELRLFEVEDGTDGKFHVRSHTTEIKECWLNSLLLNGTQNCSCIGDMILTGTPPDLVLTVRLDNVKKQDKGQLRLTLTNDAGTDYLDFSLRDSEAGYKTSEVATAFAFTDVFSGTTSGATRPVHTSLHDSSVELTNIAAIIASVLIVGIISTSITIICVKKASRTYDQPSVMWREGRVQILERYPESEPSTNSSHSRHTYMEVEHREFSSAGVRHCQAPLEDPDGYLHAVASDPAEPDYQDCKSGGSNL